MMNKTTTSFPKLQKHSALSKRPSTQSTKTRIFPPIRNIRSVLNVRTIENITNASPIEIIPPEIIFKDIEANYTYEITVLVRNLTKKPRRIRIGQPKTSNFRCDYDMVEARAAGIPMKLVVSFETNDLGEKEFFYDKLLIISEGIS